MSRNPSSDPKPFFFENGSVGILLLHGLIGAPAEMRPLGKHLADEGYTVHGPRLAGHGTCASDLAHLRWTDWLASARLGLDELQVCCEHVVVMGLSMGALLSLRLAMERPEICGVALMAPALEISLPILPWAEKMSRVIPEIPRFGRVFHGLVDPRRSSELWSYPVFPTSALHEFYLLQQQAQSWLPHVRQPLLLLHGKMDPTVPARAAKTVFERVSSEDKEMHVLERSGHIVTVDQEQERVLSLVSTWLNSRFER